MIRGVVVQLIENDDKCLNSSNSQSDGQAGRSHGSSVSPSIPPTESITKSLSEWINPAGDTELPSLSSKPISYVSTIRPKL